VLPPVVKGRSSQRLLRPGATASGATAFIYIIWMGYSRPLLLILVLISAFVAVADTPSQSTPYWAYCINSDSAPAPQADNNQHHVPGSEASFTVAETKDLFSLPDWHPSQHPAMPPIVSHGRKPDVYACGYCHLPNGLGRPENSSLAGLPAEYMVLQVSDFRSGARKSSEPKHLPVTNMITHETKATEEEIAAAADYFSKLPAKPWVRVVETSTVPKTHVAGWMLVADTPAASEPIGHRIIEIPEDLERTELRDDRSGFVAYVPPGSLKKGKWLAAGADKKMARCSKCHGPELRGMGDVPPVAGRSPSYIFRQLYDMKSGARSGPSSLQMQPLVKNLSVDDMIAIAAYASSLKP
jgi:cytochrome c553